MRTKKYHSRFKFFLCLYLIYIEETISQNVRVKETVSQNVKWKRQSLRMSNGDLPWLSGAEHKDAIFWFSTHFLKILTTPNVANTVVLILLFENNAFSFNKMFNLV